MRTSRRHYFMTGATGALGREVLPRLLLSDPDTRVSILVRDQGAGGTYRKIRELRAYLDYYWQRSWRSRIDVVTGDLTQPRLGIDPDQRDALAERVTHIVHCAAEIDLGRDLEQARHVNVEGTRAVLDFAESCPRLERLSYVSTAYVSGKRQGVFAETFLPPSTQFHNAYERSKWEAEELVRRSGKRIPALIFRPGVIVGNSRDGHLACISGIYLPLRAIASGLLDEIPGFADAPLDLVPIDYVAKAIVELTRNSPRRSAIYHLTAGLGGYLTVGELVDRARRFFRGRASSAVRFTNCSPLGPSSPETTNGSRLSSRRLRRFEVFFSYLEGNRLFDDAQTREDLKDALPPPPHPHSYLDALFTYCETTRWGTRPMWELTPQLEEEKSWIRSA